MTPVYLTSTYVQDGLGRHKGYEYARSQNPTREALERNVAALEGARHGFAFASGTACVDSMMKLFKAGDHVVCGENVYGGTFRLFDRILEHFGLEFTYVDTRDPNRIEEALHESERSRFSSRRRPTRSCASRISAPPPRSRIEPTLMMIVDNTFATPVLPAPVLARGGHRLPLHDEIPQRPQRHDRRDRRAQRRRARDAPRVHPERRRSRPGSVRLLARASGHEDAPPARRGARRQRTPGRGLAGEQGRRRARDLPGTPVPPAARARAAADVRFRRHDHRRIGHAASAPPTSSSARESFPSRNRWEESRASSVTPRR